MEGQSTKTTFTTLGLRVSRDFDLAGRILSARGMIGWRHAFGDTVPIGRYSFAGNAFTIAGVLITKDAAVIELDMDYDIADRTKLGISYHGQLAPGAQEHGLRARLRTHF